MRIRTGVRGLLLGGVLAIVLCVIGAIAMCLWLGDYRIHLVTLALLTTTGPLIARVFEGFVRRAQRVCGLPMDCLEADDEVLIARTVPLVMPVAGALFAFTVMV